MTGRYQEELKRDISDSNLLTQSQSELRGTTNKKLRITTKTEDSKSQH